MTGTSLSVMVTVPVTAPPATGLNTTVMVQITWAASVAVQLLLAPGVTRENGPEKTTLIPVRVRLPVLLSVRVKEALVAPCPTVPKLYEVGDTLAAPQLPGFCNSTAPMSELHPVPSGLTWPKKSKAVPGTVTPVGSTSTVGDRKST